MSVCCAPFLKSWCCSTCVTVLCIACRLSKALSKFEMKPTYEDVYQTQHPNVDEYLRHVQQSTLLSAIQVSLTTCNDTKCTNVYVCMYVITVLPSSCPLPFAKILLHLECCTACPHVCYEVYSDVSAQVFLLQVAYVSATHPHHAQGRRGTELHFVSICICGCMPKQAM